jgi:hypothetical protein
MAGLLARASTNASPSHIVTLKSKRYSGLLACPHLQLRGQLQFLTGFPFKQLNCHQTTTFSIKLSILLLYIGF